MNVVLIIATIGAVLFVWFCWKIAEELAEAHDGLHTAVVFVGVLITVCAGSALYIVPFIMGWAAMLMVLITMCMLTLSFAAAGRDPY